MATLRDDPIMTMVTAQKVFDVTEEDELVYLLNSLSAKARAYLGRVQINQDLTTSIVERLRGPSSEVLFLHAPAYTIDYDTYPLTVKVYNRGVIGTTYTADDLDVLVTSDDFSAQVYLASGCFPETMGGDFIEIEYFGGWESMPGDIFTGAILQGRVELKRMRGEVGMTNHSKGGESIGVDQHGLIKEVADMWQPYRMLI